LWMMNEPSVKPAAKWQSRSAFQHIWLIQPNRHHELWRVKILMPSWSTYVFPELEGSISGRCVSATSGPALCAQPMSANCACLASERQTLAAVSRTAGRSFEYAAFLAGGAVRARATCLEPCTTESFGQMHHHGVLSACEDRSGSNEQRQTRLPA